MFYTCVVLNCCCCCCSCCWCCCYCCCLLFVFRAAFFSRASAQEQPAPWPPVGCCCCCWSPPGGCSWRGALQRHGFSPAWSSSWGRLSPQPGAVVCGLGSALAGSAPCWSFPPEAAGIGTAPAVGLLFAAGPRHGAAPRDLGGPGHAPGGAGDSGHGRASSMPFACSWCSHSCWQSCAPRT